jgi:hypothetical protein
MTALLSRRFTSRLKQLPLKNGRRACSFARTGFPFDDAADEAGSRRRRRYSAPAVEAAFDDFDNALASSLEDVSPLKDDLPDDDRPMDDEFAASVEQGFLLETIDGRL